MTVNVEPADLRSYQQSVETWVRRTFGDGSLEDPTERALRLVEEAVEMALGLAEAAAQDVVSHVYGRPSGDPAQEAGGVINVLAAACAARGIDLWDEALRELRRVEDPAVIAKCRRKNAQKAAAGISTGWVPNKVLFGENLYEMDAAYSEGVRAARSGRVRFDSVPYTEGSDAAHSWSHGFDNGCEWDHIDEHGQDLLDMPGAGSEFIAPDTPAHPAS